jgi:hypothetical protein
MIIYPYNPTSQSARGLAKELGCKLMKAEGSKYNGKFVVNWGCGKPFHVPVKCRVLNDPTSVGIATNKLKTFSALTVSNVNHVPWTTNKADAQAWLNAGQIVIARLKLQAHSGVGIEVVHPGGVLPDAPLYTMYVKKRKEFRVHVLGGAVIHVSQKKKKVGVEVDPLIRSHLKGWVFCQDGIVEPNTLRQTAIDAVKALGLDFGGVDIIWNESKNQCYILEINTAPGIEGTTVTKYADAIKALAAAPAAL